MKRLAIVFERPGRDEKGAVAIEYALIAALIAVAIITAVTLAGGGLGDLFNYVSTSAGNVFDGAMGGS